MIKFIFIKIALLQLCIPLTYSFQVTFRKNITLDPNDFFVVTHDYIKDLTYTTNDYIDNVKTQYTVTLTYPYDNTPFDVFVLNTEEFGCYNSSQDSSDPSALSNCSSRFLNSPDKTFLSKTSISNNLYSGQIKDLNTLTSYIVIDNTQFPRIIDDNSAYIGAYQNLPLNIDIYVISEYNLSSVYYEAFLALLSVIIVVGAGLVIFLIVYYYKYKVLQKKISKLKKIIESE